LRQTGALGGSTSIIRARPTSLIVAFCAVSLMVTEWASSPTPAAATVPTIVVSIEWHDGNADQIDVPPILDSRHMHATWVVNTDPILAGDPSKLSVTDVQAIFADGNEVGGHTLDHVNVKPLSFADAAHQICVDRNNLLDIPVQPTTFAYPFASFDSGSEDVAHYCNYNTRAPRPAFR
jgi:Polysaccharide deacetylase